MSTTDAADASSSFYAKPWPLDKMPVLSADGSNAHHWFILAEAMIAGRRASDLITRDPAPDNDRELEMAANLKQFLMFTVDTELLSEIAPLSHLETWKRLKMVAPDTPIEDVDTAHKVSTFNNHPSAADYVRAHRKRHDALIRASPGHYLSSPPAYIKDITTGLPGSVRAEIIREKYNAVTPKTIETANELLAKVLDLPPPSHKDKSDKKDKEGSGTNRNNNKRFGRKPFQKHLRQLYACEDHLMDNHKKDDQVCKEMKARAAARGNAGSSTYTPSVAAISAEDALANAISNSIASIFTGETTKDNTVKNNINHYLSAPLLDTCATHHMTKRSECLTDATQQQNNVRLANNARTHGTHIGSASLLGAKTAIHLTNVLAVPDLANDIVSAPLLAQTNDIHIQGNRFYITPPHRRKPDNIIAAGSVQSGVFRFDKMQADQTQQPQHRAAAQVPIAVKAAHEALAHVNPAAIARAIRAHPQLRHLISNAKGTYTCKPCATAKLTKAPHKSSSTEGQLPFQKISIDTAGPLPKSSRGNKYFTVLVDKISGWIDALPSAKKSDAGRLIVNALRKIQLESGRPVLRLHTDGAPELSAGAPLRYAQKAGIRITKAVPNAPQSNGQAERTVRTLKECIRAQLAAAQLPQNYWDYALADCVAKRNATPAPLQTQPPMQLAFSRPSRLPLHLPFGASGYVPNRGRQLKSFAPRGIKCRYLAPTSTDTVKVLKTPGRQEIDARAADFVPTIDITHSDDRLPATTKQTREKIVQAIRKRSAAVHTPDTDRVMRPRSAIKLPLRFRTSQEPPPPHKQTPKAPLPPTAQPYDDAAVAAIQVETRTPVRTPPDPKSIKNALLSPYGKQWAQAHDGFIDKMGSIGAWAYVTPLPNDKPVHNIWRYHYKSDADGFLAGCSARCTVRGDRMRAGEHFDALRTAAQSPSHTARRLLHANAALHGERVRQFDVPSAYPRAPADARYRVTMHQPRRSDGTYTAPGKLVLIKRAQMGSPDGGFLWERHRNARLRSWGWVPCQAESGCFLYRDATTGATARLLVDTDDMLMSSASDGLLDRLAAHLHCEWQVTEQQPVTQHMGVAISYTKDGVRLSVRKHIEELLADFKLTAANSTALPHDPKADLSGIHEGETVLAEDEHRLYRHGVGLARFIADTVVYDIAYIVSHLARSLETPTSRHMAALKRVVRYLAGQRNAYIEYKHAADPVLRAYSDSEWAACTNTRRSRTGIAITWAGDLLFWKSKLQASVTLSTAEAEYAAACEAARVIVWLYTLASEWDIPIKAPILLSIDNTAALAMSVANGPTTRSKHIDTKARYVTEQVERGIVDTNHVPGEKMVADMFTKPLPRLKFINNLRLIRNRGSEAARGC